jgi:hypothetical protein
MFAIPNLTLALRRATLTLLIGTAALGTVACGDDDGGGPSRIEGTYALQSVDGDDLPVTGTINGFDITVEDGDLVIDDDGTWEVVISGEVNGNPDDIIEDFGTWDRNGNSVSFESDAFGDQFDGTLSGRRLTIDYDVDGDGTAETEFLFER